MVNLEHNTRSAVRNIPREMPRRDYRGRITSPEISLDVMDRVRRNENRLYNPLKSGNELEPDKYRDVVPNIGACHCPCPKPISAAYVAFAPI